jgi:hypothetical protein
MNKIDIDLLIFLLERHQEEGSYFGNKEFHYKRVERLLDELNKMKGGNNNGRNNKQIHK